MENKVTLDSSFFQRDVLDVAQELPGKILVRDLPEGRIHLPISEIEIYRGEEDQACHAHKGRTARTEIMYHAGGVIYMYLIYGIHWMFNIVCGKKNDPQAVLVRGLGNVFGPGKVSNLLRLDKSFYGLELSVGSGIWIENAPLKRSFRKTRRIGIDYAGEEWREKEWRFILDDEVSV